MTPDCSIPVGAVIDVSVCHCAGELVLFIFDHAGS